MSSSTSSASTVPESAQGKRFFKTRKTSAAIVPSVRLSAKSREFDLYQQAVKTKSMARYGNLVYEIVNVYMASAGYGQDYGFVVAGYCPCYVENVYEDSVASRSGLRRGDAIVKINEVNCCRATLKSVLTLIKASSSELKLTVYRPSASDMHEMLTPKLPSLKSASVYSTVKPKTKLALKMVDQSKMMPISKKKKNGSKLFANIFKPSLWLSCAVPKLACGSSMNDMSMNNTTVYTIKKKSAPVKKASDYETMTLENDQSKQTECHSSNTEYPRCDRDCCQSNCHSTVQMMTKSSSIGDTGYETLSRCDSAINSKCETQESNKLSEKDETIATASDIYSDCDLTIDDYTPNTTIVTVHKSEEKKTEPVAKPEKHSAKARRASTARQLTNSTIELYNEKRTELIGNLIEMEANFVSYLTMAVATFSRPLRSFFMKQQDYFCLFQNIEKILIISENFLRSMKRWSAYDLYTRIGQLYSQKISLFREAFSIYVKGYARAKLLLRDLMSHSKQFRLYLKETQSSSLRLEDFIDLPIFHMSETLEIFKQIAVYTVESKHNPAEASHIESVIADLEMILSSQDVSAIDEQETANEESIGYYFDGQEEEDMTEYEGETEDDGTASSTLFLETITTIGEEETEEEVDDETGLSQLTRTQTDYEISSCCSSTSTLTSTSSLGMAPISDSFYSSTSIFDRI